MDSVPQLSETEKRDLQRSFENELQKAKFQENVHNLTEICWEKCVTGKITSGKLDKGEESCAQNCVERFLDANGVIMKHLDVLRGGEKI